MKIRDPKTGAIFQDVDSALDRFCENDFECEDCPLAEGEDDCEVFADKYPEKAIELMGYEIMDENVPNICKVLNVQPLEEFKYNCRTYRIADDGWLEIKADGGDFCEIENLTYPRESIIDLICMINYPEKIVYTTNWTERDIEDALCVLRLYPKADTVEKNDGILTIHNEFYDAFIDNPDLFPSLLDGKSIELSEVANYGKAQD